MYEHNLYIPVDYVNYKCIYCLCVRSMQFYMYRHTDMCNIYYFNASIYKCR